MQLNDVLGCSWTPYGPDFGPSLVQIVWEGGKRAKKFSDLPESYCFVESSANTLIESLPFDDIRAVEPLDAQYARGIRGELVTKITTTLPTTIGFINDLIANRVKVFEGDIPKGKREFIDKGMTIPNKLRPLYLDIEIDPRLRNPNLDTNPATRVISTGMMDLEDHEWWFCDDSEEQIFEWTNEVMQNYTHVLSWSDMDYKYLKLRGRKMGYRADWIYSIDRLDLMDIFSRLKVAGRYPSLVDVSKKLGIRFTDYHVKEDYSILYDWFNRQRLKLKEYNMEDVRVLREIDTISQLNSSIEEMLMQFNIFISEFQYTSRIIDWLLLRLAGSREPRLVLPVKPIRFMDPKARGKNISLYTGGFVVDPVVGPHEIVGALDFKAMYSSIMKSLNIGVDTADPNGIIHTPGLNFSNSSNGLNRDLLLSLDIVLVRYTKELEAAQPDTIDYIKAFVKRKGIKVIINSDYGVIGSPVCRLFDTKVVESITLTGQILILFVISLANKLGYSVVYGDTDSLFVKLGTTNLDDINGLINLINNELHKFSKLQFGVEVETEVELDVLYEWLWLTKAKKRYFGKAIWEKQPCNYIKAMGFEVRRRDWTELAKEVQRWLFSVLGSTIEQKTTIDDVWVNIIKPKIDVLYEELLAGKLDGKIVYTKNMKRDITAYKSSLPHTRAAQILIDRGLLGPREPIKYIIVKVERQKVPVFKDGKPIMYKRDPTKQRQKSKKVIVTYPLISDRPAIELSGYEYAWKSQVLAMLDRFGLLTKYVSPDAVKEVNEASHTTGVITMMLK